MQNIKLTIDKKDIKNKKENNVEKELEELKRKAEEFDTLKNLALQLENLYKRAVADYQNLEKRVAGEKKTLIVNANKHLLLRLLPVLDTLMLALQHTKDKGLELSVRQFIGALETEGLQKIETKGKIFDPLVMECIGTKEGEEWKVLEETRSGYKLGDMILRPALVVVGKKEILKQVQDDKDKKVN